MIFGKTFVSLLATATLLMTGPVSAQQNNLSEAMTGIGNALATGNSVSTQTTTQRLPTVQTHRMPSYRAGNAPVIPNYSGSTYSTGQIVRQNMNGTLNNSLGNNTLGNAVNGAMNGSGYDTRSQVKQLTNQMMPKGVTVDPYQLLNK